MYSRVRLVSSVVKSDHKAIVATCMCEGAVKLHCKNEQRRTFRPKTPSQNAIFLQSLASTGFDFDDQCPPTEPQAAYDSFYTMALDMLNSFYPECTITVSSRDPSYMTPEIKTKLRREKVEEAKCSSPTD